MILSDEERLFMSLFLDQIFLEFVDALKLNLQLLFNLWICVDESVFRIENSVALGRVVHH